MQIRGIASLDNLFKNNEALEQVVINGYPVLVIFWNIILLIVPFVIAWFLISYWKKNKFKKVTQKIIAGITGFIWLLFVPNIAYVITDVRHLASFCSVSAPHRVCASDAWLIFFFFTYGILGWIAYVYSLRQIKEWLFKINKNLSKLFLILIIPLISLGLLLGLLDRWNSWEFFANPLGLLQNIVFYFTNFNYFFNWLIFSVFLYILYWIGDMLFLNSTNLKKKIKK